MPPPPPLEADEKEIWAYVEAFDAAYFAGTHFNDRGAWLDGFDRIGQLLRAKDAGARFRLHVMYETIFTLVPSAIALYFIADPQPIAAAIGTFLGFLGAFRTLDGIFKERRARTARRLLRFIVVNRVQQL